MVVDGLDEIDELGGLGEFGGDL
ncbi:unnamed protein product, partial [Rotaria magnacalcarata]